MGGPCAALIHLARLVQRSRTEAVHRTRLSQRRPPRAIVRVIGALAVLCCWQLVYRQDATNSASPVPPSALHLLRLSAALHTPSVGTAEPVSPASLRRCLLQRPRRILLAGHSRVWQLFWAAVGRSGAELRSRTAPPHGPPYGGDTPPPPPASAVPDTCVEVFRRPAGDSRPPACSWAADAPGLQLDLRWRLRVDEQLGRLLTEAARPGQIPDLLVIAVALKETVRERVLQISPHSLWDALWHHLVVPLRALTAAGVTSVLLLDYPPNRHRAGVPYDRGAGAATLVQNALIMRAAQQVPGLHVWTSPMPHVVQFYTETCRQPPRLLDSETASRCSNDTFHPGHEVVDQLLDQLLHVLCQPDDHGAFIIP